MTVKSLLAIGVVGVVLVFCLVTVARLAGQPEVRWHTRVGDMQSPRLGGPRWTWYCYDKGEPRPHIEDAAYFDHPCSEDELRPVEDELPLVGQ